MKTKYYQATFKCIYIRYILFIVFAIYRSNKFTGEIKKTHSVYLIVPVIPEFQNNILSIIILLFQPAFSGKNC